MTMKKYDCVVFDVDGTLLNTEEGILSAVKYTIEYFRLSPIDNQLLRTFIGPPIQQSFASIYHLEGEIIQEIATVFRNRYKESDLYKATPYSGIYDVFDALIKNGIKPAIATYKRHDYAISLLKHFGFDRYTDALYGADHENKLSKSDIIRLALHDCEIVDYQKAIMIGDTYHDAKGAANLGVPFLGVTYGFGFQSEADVFQYPAVGAAASALEILDYLI